MRWEGLLFAGIGLFAICGAAFEWGFFMNHHKAKFLTGLFGRNGTRGFYIALGLLLLVGGMLFAFGVIKNSA